jgi:hypothetical protein
MASTSNPRVDNRDANISQQINVVGTANFAPPLAPLAPTPVPAKTRSPILRMSGLTALVVGLALYVMDPMPLEHGDGSLQGGLQKGEKPGRFRALSSPETPPAIKDILDGLNPVVQACRTKDDGIEPGKEVFTLLVINGATGTMTSFTALGDFAGKPLEKCIEAEIKKARFPLFDGHPQKFRHTFTM